MAAHDPLEILLAQNLWATRNVLEACGKLSHEKFHQRFEMGRGSLHDTLTHILAALRGWGDMLAGREQRDRLDEQGVQRTPRQLTTLLDEISADIESSAVAHPLESTATGSRGGRSYTFTRGAVLTHLMTHGMHHRAQCLNMLRRLGIEPLPPTSVLEWMLMVDGQG